MQKKNSLFSYEYWANLFGSGFRPWRRFFSKTVHILYAASRGFSEDDCSARASALTFFSLLSIVPLLAVALGIAKGFGFEKHLENELVQKFLEQKEVADKLIDFAYRALQNTQSGLIAGAGIVLLFWSVFQLLGNIESSFNAIWRVKEMRPWSRRLSDYLAMMLFCPIFFAASSSVSIFVITQIEDYSHSRGLWETVGPFITLAFHLFPLILSWMLFTAIYYIMPNTKVSFGFAVLAGIIAGTIYQVVQWIYIQFQLGLASYGAIYGSLAALPLFLIWLNTSWQIALFGAEIAYHTENEITSASLSLEQDSGQVDTRVVGLMIMQQAIKAFYAGEEPPTVVSLSKHTGIAVFTTRRIVEHLLEAHLLVEVVWQNGESGYFQPGRDLKTITIKAVCDALDEARLQRHLVARDHEVESYEKALKECDELLKNSSINCPIENLIATR